MILVFIKQKKITLGYNFCRENDNCHFTISIIVATLRREKNCT